MSYQIAKIKYMFDIEQPGGRSGVIPETGFITPDTGTTTTGTAPGPDPIPDPSPGPDSVPLERLESQICELAGHLAAATCRFLVLLGDFDARKGWADWEMTSCAQWLSWKCQLSSGTAREHARVARALRDLP
jgi:hypothetical protein